MHGMDVMTIDFDSHDDDDNCNEQADDVLVRLTQRKFSAVGN